MQACAVRSELVTTVVITWIRWRPFHPPPKSACWNSVCAQSATQESDTASAQPRHPSPLTAHKDKQRVVREDGGLK